MYIGIYIGPTTVFRAGPCRVMQCTPFQVSIKEGRHFWLDLKGTTVPPQFPMLYVPTGEILNPGTLLWYLRTTIINN